MNVSFSPNRNAPMMLPHNYVHNQSKLKKKRKKERERKWEKSDHDRLIDES